MRGATILGYSVGQLFEFQLTRPMRGATQNLSLFFRRHISISTHTPHAGRNIRLPNPPRISSLFQLTRPMRGATYGILVSSLIFSFNFNSHAPCGAQHSFGSKIETFSSNISTHTPHAGRNPSRPAIDISDCVNFNSHAPCGAQRNSAMYPSNGTLSFQLTRPMRGATRAVICQRRITVVHFNSHAPCGAQHVFRLWLEECAVISTHTPHAGRNPSNDTPSTVLGVVFQLTRPMRGATDNPFVIGSLFDNFNSHAPCGAQPILSFTGVTNSSFQLTRPMRGATHCSFNYVFALNLISTHTPHAGRNFGFFPCVVEFIISTHTPHAGRNYSFQFCCCVNIAFQLTRPMRGATWLFYRNFDRLWHFNSHAPCGAQLLSHKKNAVLLEFQLTRPMRGATPVRR